MNGIRKQTKQKIQINNFIGLQNNRHPSQQPVGNVHKASGNCQERLFRNRSQNRCHTFLDCRRTAAFQKRHLSGMRNSRPSTTRKLPKRRMWLFKYLHRQLLTCRFSQSNSTSGQSLVCHSKNVETYEGNGVLQRWRNRLERDNEDPPNSSSLPH
jgi:hypothetical protein